MAPGHEREQPSDDHLREFCNLGYAQGCRRLPVDRAWDSVRFGIGKSAADASDAHIYIRYVCERGHLPMEHGTLEYDPMQKIWPRMHSDLRVQSMAECFLAAHTQAVRTQS
ncbi:MAG TPA: hypothetical protein VND65_04035 [Candidatus Binatia bacterium]|nr:hypothetical protein [Candidatus Binatia bacterium]